MERHAWEKKGKMSFFFTRFLDKTLRLCYAVDVKEPCQKGDDRVKNRVEALRRARGLNQEEFARALRVSRQTISSIETGKYNPSLELAFAIADYFSMTIEEIFIHEHANRREDDE